MDSNKKPTYQELEKLIDDLRTESKLKTTENRFSAFLKESEDMITIHKPNGEYLYYNGPACYAITSQDIVGKMPNDLFDKDVSSTLLNAFKKVEKTGRSETLEVFFDWLGEKKWFSEYIYPVKNTDGEVVEIVKVCRDIHKRKIAEEELKSLVEDAGDAIFRTDSKGLLTYVNGIALKIIKKEKDSLIGLHFTEWVHSDYKKNTALFYAEQVMSRTPVTYYEFMALDGNGEEMWIGQNVNLIYEKDKISGFQGVARDITDTKKAQIKLTNTLARMSLLITSLNTGILLENSERKILLTNSEFCKIFGIEAKPEQLVGADCRDSAKQVKHLFRNPDRFESDINSLLAGKEKVIGEEIIMNNGNIYKRDFIPIVEEDEYLGHLWQYKDVTKEKLLQKIEVSRTKVLEKITQGEKLSAIFEFVVHEFEKENPTSLCSILILSADGKKLLHGAAPSLPEFYNNAINGVEIGRSVGSCGHAAFTRKRIIVEDIQTHPNWKLFKDLAKKANLAACWSQPITDGLGAVLGTFAIYHKEIAKPTKTDIFNIKSLANIIAIAIERSQLHHNLTIIKEKAQESEKRLKEAQGLARVGSWAFDFSTQKLEWSEEAFRIWGFDSKKPMPKTSIIRSRIHPDYLELFNSSLEKASRGAPYNVELLLLLPDDESKTVKSICKPLLGEDGKVVSVQGSVQDITELKNEHLKIEKTEKRLNEAQKLARVGSWTFDLSTQKNEWSDETFVIWGLDPKKGVPDFDGLVKQIHTDDQELFNSSIANASNIGTPYDIEFRIYLSTGKKKWVRAICKPLLGSDSEVVSISGTNQDISSQKQFEKAQVKHQRLKAIGEMSASVAHDFNNSLQQMAGNLEIIKFQKGLSDSIIERLNNIGTIISDTADRVSALQRFGDQENDDKTAILIDFNVLIQEGLIQSRPVWKDGMEKQGLTVNVITDFQDIPKISCNKGELKSAVYNIIKNGIEAMPKGGDLIIKTSTKDERVFVTFTDTGVGMDEEVKLKVFDPFFSTKGFKLGRGLGMSGVYNIVKKYGGDIVIKSSELGKGTTFEIVFPMAEQDESKVLRKNKPKEKKSFRVLWVDDDTIITEDVSELIGLIGHTCATENSGKDALAYLDKNTCDIVFTDIGMPGMNGWELIAAIREKFGNKIKIVTVSGWAIEAKVQKENTIDFVLQKPFTLDALEEFFSAL